MENIRLRGEFPNFYSLIKLRCGTNKLQVRTLVKLDMKHNEKDLYIYIYIYTLAFILTPFRKLRRFTIASAFAALIKSFVMKF